MPTFTDYAFYKDRYRGGMREAEYNAAAHAAYAEILSQTNSAALTAPASMQEAVKLCECELADVIGAYRKGANLLPRGVGAVSNDGYTVSGTADPAKAEAQERRSICARYLQQPVNLMNRWA